jgi:hypothetical protein
MVNSQELNKTISDLELQVKKFKNISEVYSELINLKTELVRIKQLTGASSESIKIITQKIDEKLVAYENFIFDLKKENKIFHNDLQDHIISKLEKHKSDIQVEIRNEGMQIQRGFENSLTLNFNNLQSKIQEINYKQEKKISVVQTLLLIVIVLCLGLGAILLLK